MAYRRPGIQVTQEFVDLLPALAAFALPSCVIGDTYQVLSADQLGDYAGVAISYNYVSLDAGNLVDTRLLNEEELLDHQYPITVRLVDAKVEQFVERETGVISGNLTVFTDATLDAFAEVIEGDEIEIFQRTIEIVSPKTDGTSAVGSPSILVSTGLTDLADVLIGDTVVITAGTDVTPGSYLVLAKSDDQTIQLDANFYIGAGTSADIAYTVERITGVNNQGFYTVAKIVDVNTLELVAPLPDDEGPIAYRALRKIVEIPLTRDVHYTADEASIDILGSILLDGKVIAFGTTEADYRGLRIDLAADVKEYKSISDLQATFGVDQIVPANPLAFGLFISLSNTVTAVNGLGLGASYYTNESLAYAAALDVLKKTEMYCLTPLTQAPVVHQLFGTHVTQMSLPEKKKERVAMLNKKMIQVETVLDSTVTDGLRTIVNTKTDGIVVLGDSTLSAPAADYVAVLVGDVVEVVGGTGVTIGDYVVASVDSDTQLTLTGFTVTANATDVQYFVKRAYGIEANGQVLFDGDATFITDGVAAGYFVVVEAGGFAGRYQILSVDSDKQVTMEQIPGIVSNQSPIAYRVEKDLSKTEIAEFVAGYASAFSNRRLVITFPDIVKIPEGPILRELPGFYLGCAVGGLTTGLPTQQGFTNLTVSGFLGFIHSGDFFDEDQLDIIAGGGNMIFDQEVPEAPLFIRHELTTDLSAIKFQEYQVTKNVDFISKFIRNAFKGFPGVYNIVDGTYDEIKSTSTAVMKFLQEDTSQPRIGGVIKSGKLSKLEEGTNIDSIAMRFKLDIPIPLNNLDIVVQV